MNITMNLGTLAVVVLVVTMTSCLVALLWLCIWTRAGTSHSLHCGHCHSLLAVRDVNKAPESLPVYSPRFCLVPPYIPRQQYEAVVGGGGLHQSAVDSYLRLAGENSEHGRELKIIYTKDQSSSTSPVPGTKGFLVSYPMDVSVKTSKIKTPSYLRDSDSIIVPSKHKMFQRTCSTRKKCLPRLRRPCVEQSEPGWLDISQMCRTVLSKISPRQRSNTCNDDRLEAVRTGYSKVNPGPLEHIGITNRQEDPINHNYVYPLNDVERYNALVLEMKNKIIPTPTPSQRELYPDKKTNNRKSWGSTLPEYTEFLI